MSEWKPMGKRGMSEWKSMGKRGMSEWENGRTGNE